MSPQFVVGLSVGLGVGNFAAQWFLYGDLKRAVTVGLLSAIISAILAGFISKIG